MVCEKNMCFFNLLYFSWQKMLRVAIVLFRICIILVVVGGMVFLVMFESASANIVVFIIGSSQVQAKGLLLVTFELALAKKVVLILG
ncbi:hypothetical protein HanIR_Chr04g0168861 [Helianthus annuus]|nr:hypothetical protein HanIR_Chr04g0168861 [Helianthus annuus]